MKRIFCILFAVIFVCTSNVFAAHWADEYLNGAVGQGVIDGKADLDSNVTRLEFIQLMMKSLDFLPESSVAKAIVPPSGYEETGNKWVDLAILSGMIQLADYNGNYDYNENITRQDAVIVATRALGRLKPALEFDSKEAYSNDWNQLPYWAKGLAYELLGLDILKGYPDKTLQLNNLLTMGEALAITQRASKENLKGIDNDIKLLAVDWRSESNEPAIEVPLIVPAQVINNNIYIPARCVFGSGNYVYSLSNDFPKDEERLKRMINEQNFKINIDDLCYYFTTGNSPYSMYDSYYVGSMDRFTNRDLAPMNIPAPARLQSGELMLPMVVDGKPVVFGHNPKATDYDPENKTVTVYMRPVIRNPS